MERKRKEERIGCRRGKKGQLWIKKKIKEKNNEFVLYLSIEYTGIVCITHTRLTEAKKKIDQF